MSIYHTCQVCRKPNLSTGQLSKHLRDHHKSIGLQIYYDTHFKEEKEGICFCGKPTKYLNLGIGYRPTCGNVCAGILKREKLRNDPLKFKAFTDAVSQNQTQIWANRGPDKWTILDKTHSKFITWQNTLTPQEKRENFSRYYRCDDETIQRLNATGKKQLLENFEKGLGGYQSMLKGKYRPKHPEKYVGDVTNIIHRSSWERKFMRYLDENANVLEWSSEELVIPYRSPVDNRVHRYYPDFKLKAKSKEGLIKTIVVEIKPEKETKEPWKQKKITRRYITEVMTWGVNSSKWAAAREFCENRGWEFQIMTETDLGIT